MRKAVSLASSPDLAHFMITVDDVVGEKCALHLYKVCTWGQGACLPAWWVGCSFGGLFTCLVGWL